MDGWVGGRADQRMGAGMGLRMGQCADEESVEQTEVGDLKKAIAAEDFEHLASERPQTVKWRCGDLRVAAVSLPAINMGQVLFN